MIFRCQDIKNEDDEKRDTLPSDEEDMVTAGMDSSESEMNNEFSPLDINRMEQYNDDSNIGIALVEDIDNTEMNELNMNANDGVFDENMESEEVEIKRVWTCNILFCVHWIFRLLAFLILSVLLASLISYHTQKCDEYLNNWTDVVLERVIYVLSADTFVQVLIFGSLVLLVVIIDIIFCLR